MEVKDSVISSSTGNMDLSEKLILLAMGKVKMHQEHEVLVNDKLNKLNEKKERAASRSAFIWGVSSLLSLTGSRSLTGKVFGSPALAFGGIFFGGVLGSVYFQSMLSGDDTLEQLNNITMHYDFDTQENKEFLETFK